MVIRLRIRHIVVRSVVVVVAAAGVVAAAAVEGGVGRARSRSGSRSKIGAQTWSNIGPRFPAHT